MQFGCLALTFIFAICRCYTGLSNYLIVYILVFTYSFIFGEGNGTPLQYSCLENPMDGGAW